MTFAQSILGIISLLLSFLNFVVFVYIILSLLFSFGVIQRGNQLAGQIYGLLGSVCEPVLRPFRELQYKLLPNLRTVDLSPIFLIVVIWWVQNYLIDSVLMPMFG